MGRKRPRLHVVGKYADKPERRQRLCPDTEICEGTKNDIRAMLAACLPDASAQKGRKRAPDAAADSVSVTFFLGKDGKKIDVGNVWVSRRDLRDDRLDFLWEKVEAVRGTALGMLPEKQEPAAAE